MRDSSNESVSARERPDLPLPGPGRAAPSEPSATRRRVIAGVGATGAALALAACGTAPPGSEADTGSFAPAPAAPASPSAAGAPSNAPGKASGSASGKPADKPAGTRLAKATDIPVGGGKVFADRQVVVTQPAAGSYKAFTAICTHEGCTVNKVADGTIQCPCHGSQYSISDGSVKTGPATKALPAMKVTVAGGQLYLA